MSTGVYRPIPQPPQRRIRTYPAAPQLVVVPLDGSSTPGATVAARTVVLGSRTGSCTPTGTLTKAVARATLTGSVTPSGVVTPTRVAVVATQTGSCTPTGLFGPLTIGKVVAGSSTPTGAITKADFKATLLASSTPTGLVAPHRIVPRIVGGTSTPTGSLALTPVKLFAGSGTSTGALPARVITHKVSGSSTPTGAVTSTRLPARGTRVSPGKAIPGGPIAGSLIVWEVDEPPGTTTSVETSVDGGATWQPATNGGEIAHLPPRSTTARAVLVRETLTRIKGADPSPVFHRLEFAVDVDTTRAELVPLGVFSLNETDIVDGENGVELTLSGADFSRKIARNPWEEILVIPAGTNMADAIKQVVSDRLPGVTFNFCSTGTVTFQLTFGAQSSNNPWTDVQDMAESIGCTIFFDPSGICTMIPEPDPEIDNPVWAFSDKAKPVVTELTRRISDTETFNVVVVTGESVDNAVPARGTAEDDDPASGTYVLGAFGRNVYRITSDLVVDDAQAGTMAAAVLRRRKGITEQVEISAVPMAALVPGDIVSITRSKSKIDDVHFLLDSVSIPLSAEDGMRLVARRQRLAGSRPLGGGVGGLGGGGGGGGTVPRTYGSPGECLKIGTNGSLNHFKLQTAFTGGSAIVEKSEAQIGTGYVASPEWCMTPDNTSVQAQVNLNAPTTSGSTNPRTELREMMQDGVTQMAFTATSGLHMVQATENIQHVPAVLKKVVVMQMHDTASDVMQVLTRVVGGVLKLMLRVNGTDNDAWVIDGAFALSTWFTLRMEVNAGVGKIYYHTGTDPTFTTPVLTTGTGGIPSLSISGGCYFKVPTYPQSTTSESSSDHATVWFRKLGHQHPGWPAPVYDSDTVSGGGATDDFTFAFGACINNPDSGAFTFIKNAAPDYFAILGDVWYKDGSTPTWNADWNAKFGATKYAAMLAALPNPQIVGVSDHDFGYANNSTGLDNPSRTAAFNAAYRTQFPSLTLPASGIYRTWTRGRIRFILLDCLTFKSRLTTADGASKTMLGSTQKSWYKGLLASSDYPLIVVLGDGQMPGPAEAGQDEWRGYAHERDELASSVGASPATVLYLNGDTHSLATGQNQYGYARCWQAAPFHNDTKVKAGGAGYDATYPTNADEGPVKELYAIVTFSDTGTEITATYRGYEAGTEQLSDTITV